MAKTIEITGPKGTVKIKPSNGPLGLVYDVLDPDGNHLVQCGGGAKGVALKRAREYANVAAGNKEPAKN